jgi:hypothetical protein
MTKQEITGKRDLRLSQWIRDNGPDSYFGYYVSDLDFIVYNKSTKKIALMESKMHHASLKPFQKEIYDHISLCIQRGLENDWQFLGFHLVQFENEFFNDGSVFFDGRQSSEEEIKKFLRTI